jgi:hypothetical protein
LSQGLVRGRERTTRSIKRVRSRPPPLQSPEWFESDRIDSVVSRDREDSVACQ